MNIIQVSVGELRIPAEAGAVEAIILDLSRELVKQGHSVTVLDRRYSENDSDFASLDGVKIARLAAKKFDLTLLMSRGYKFVYVFKIALNQFLFSFHVKRYLSRAKNIDVIHIHNSVIGLGLVMFSSKLRSKLIYTSHTPRRLMDSPTLLDRLALIPESMLIRRTKRTVALSEVARQRLLFASGGREENVVTIPFGINIAALNPTCDCEVLRYKYGLGRKSVILFVGVINQRKGVEYLVKAANIVVNEFGYRDTFFLLVGPTEAFELRRNIRTQYAAKILSLIENYRLEQNIKLTGLVSKEELADFFAMSHIFVLPTLGEAFPRVVLEAMAFGKPVISTRVGGIATQVKEGQNGFLVNPADERQLAERIRYLLDNPHEAEKMGDCGRKLVEEGFNSRRMAERLLQVYHSVSANSGNGGFH